jgi:predicted nucleic acid-binding protein
MSSYLPTNECRAYLDNTVLIDLLDPNRSRHSHAKQFLQLFQRHRNSGQLSLVTSTWALTECQGVLYENELTNRGVRIPPSVRPRNLLPPDRPSLNTANQQVVKLLQTFQTTTRFFLLPDSTRDTLPTWQLTQEIGKVAGIWPTDSIHLAFALENDCTILVTDDKDLLDKIECCQSSLIRPYRRKQFSQLNIIPPFTAYGLMPTRCRIPGRSSLRASAMQTLNALGFH